MVFQGPEYTHTATATQTHSHTHTNTQPHTQTHSHTHTQTHSHTHRPQCEAPVPPDQSLGRPAMLNSEGDFPLAGSYWHSSTCSFTAIFTTTLVFLNHFLVQLHSFAQKAGWKPPRAGGRLGPEGEWLGSEGGEREAGSEGERERGWGQRERGWGQREERERLGQRERGREAGVTIHTHTLHHRHRLGHEGLVPGVGMPGLSRPPDSTRGSSHRSPT